MQVDVQLFWDICCGILSRLKFHSMLCCFYFLLYPGMFVLCPGFYKYWICSNLDSSMVLELARTHPVAEASLLLGIVQELPIINAVCLNLAPLHPALEHVRILATAVPAVPLLLVHARAIVLSRYVRVNISVYPMLYMRARVLTVVQCCVKGAGGGSGNLPGLDATQSTHARAIIAQAKSESLGRQGCLAGIATGLTEVGSAINSRRFSICRFITNTITVESSYLRQFQCPGLTQLPS